MINIGIIGVGYWGKNLYRNFLNSQYFNLMSVADSNTMIDRQNYESANVKFSFDARDICNDPKVDAVCIATPVNTHFELAKQALENGKHVLIEKPMCLNSIECLKLIEIANKKNLVIMVDHTYLFSGGVEYIKKCIDEKKLGEICFISSIRINLGLFQQDVNVLWDLAPHDFSIINHLLGEKPDSIDAIGYSHFQNKKEDVVHVALNYKTNKKVFLQLSWMSPVKNRTMSINGSEKMLIWDDLKLEDTIKIYDSGVDQRFENDSSRFLPEYRIGDIYSPRISTSEPLSKLTKHFSDVINKKTPSIMSGEHGLGVVLMLEQAQSSLDFGLNK